MSCHPLFTLNPANRRLIARLLVSHLLWCAFTLALWAISRKLAYASPGLSAALLALQLYGAAQLLLPLLRLQAEPRSRGFYLFWGLVLLLGMWLMHQLQPVAPLQPLAAIGQSALLLLSAGLTGAALARYIQRLWEILPIALVMTLADVTSWHSGPTALFSDQIAGYYRAPDGAPPLIDMVLIKWVFPGVESLLPVFGVSDWIMAVFFALVAHRHGLHDNLLGRPAAPAPHRRQRFGRYLPVSVVALGLALILAQTSGHFIPALPFMAVTMLLWYAGRSVLRQLWR